MLNLLFISDSPRAEYIKSALQPLLKVMIDVVADFDHGLKEVFEKRPATVCIQDQIGGVTGESVARHIQMLLGNSAPTFILLHNGDGKARAIKGVYEHLIDLSQPNEIVTDNIKTTLKLLLGNKWERIYIPNELTPVSVSLLVAAPAGSREDAFGTVESDRAQAINDDLAELLLMEKDRSERDKAFVAPPSTAGDGGGSVSIDSPKSAATTPGKKETRSILAPVPVPPASPAAKFRINHDIRPDEEQLSENLLLGFEENYRSESLLFRRTVVIAIICAFCAAGGWYLVKQKPQLISSLKQRLDSPAGPRQAAVPTPVAAPVQKLVPPSLPQPLKTPPLPAFIPKDGHDSSYAVKKPGWERYVGARNEFRVFSVSGRIQALQVLAVKDASISDSWLRSVLQEFAGSKEYQITSRSTKAGVRVESGKIGNKGEIMIYRKNGEVKAFVVSIE
ncbi:MAG: hypothetical protein PHH91_05390 [Desulfuromonadaceae bacterium]|nr:hypothetical protein [Desulfuromonadaceae bacterium]